MEVGVAVVVTATVVVAGAEAVDCGGMVAVDVPDQVVAVGDSRQTPQPSDQLPPTVLLSPR